MRALNPTFELFDTAELQAAAWSGRVEQGSNLPEGGKPKESQENTKTVGTNSREYLKTKDITFFDAAYFACFARRTTPIRPQKEQQPPHFAETRPGLAAHLGMS